MVHTLPKEGRVESAGCCPLCGVFSYLLPKHFDTCFDDHAPSKKPTVLSDTDHDMWPTYKWKGFPDLCMGVSELVVKYLDLRDLSKLRCTSTCMESSAAFGKLANELCCIFRCLCTRRIPPVSSRIRSYAACVYGPDNVPKKYLVRDIRFGQDHRCHCSFPQPLSRFYDASTRRQNIFKIIRGSLLTTIVFKFRPLHGGVVVVKAEKVLWLPVRVLVELYHQAGGSFSTENGLDFIIGGRSMAHLDDPLIKYMWNGVHVGRIEFVVDVVERREHRLCSHDVGRYPAFVCFADELCVQT